MGARRELFNVRISCCMLIYHATRRWQRDYCGVEAGKSSAVNTDFKKKFNYVIEIVKTTWYIPPLSVIHTLKICFYKNVLSFAPSLPIRKGHLVALENFDSLFDFCSKKRVVYGLLAFCLLSLCRGKFVFYSSKSLESFPVRFRKSKVFKSSYVGDFFKIKKHVIDKYKKTNKEKQIVFSGDLYLKGGVELLNAFLKIAENKRFGWSLIFICPKKNKNYFFNLCNSSSVRFVEFNEDDPRGYYKILGESAALIHPTYYDSHAIVVKDAAQLGCYTVATDVFDSATGANVILKPRMSVFHNDLLSYPLTALKIIEQFSDPTRKIDEDFVLILQNEISKIIEIYG